MLIALPIQLKKSQGQKKVRRVHGTEIEKVSALMLEK